VKIIKHSTFTAGLRERKVIVPSRSGAYDYGANYHDERELVFECEILRELAKDIPAELDEFDDLKYCLSHGTQKGKIVIWDQPYRYYLGRIYEAAKVQDRFGLKTRQVRFVFICDPYAYGIEPHVLYTDINQISMSSGNRYTGTRQRKHFPVSNANK
jgi:predicted phage tail component-like protein